MRLLIILVTVFSVCCCFSVLNIFPFESNGRNFHLLKRTLVSDLLTEEEILRCRAYMDKIVGDLNKEDLQDISFKCSLILQQNIKLSSGKNNNNINRLPPFEDQNNQEQELKIPEYESSKEVNDKNTGSSEIIYKSSERNEYISATSELLSGEYEDSMVVSTAKTSKPATNNSRFWNYFFGNQGSSEDSSSVLFTEHYEDFTTEKSSEPENQKTELGSVTIKPVNTSWNIWSYFYGSSDSKDSSKKDENETKLKRSQNVNTGLNFKNSVDFELTTEMAIWNIVMPGTKWCGSGDIAKNDDDLGYFKDVDICCRAHDKCDDIMWPGETKYNLTNNSAFTLLHCKCDDELYNCLSQIDSVASNTIGNTFFNIFGRKCYSLDYPQNCKTHNSKLECIKYEIDKTAEKVYQWKPAKKYHKYPFTISG